MKQLFIVNSQQALYDGSAYDFSKLKKGQLAVAKQGEDTCQSAVLDGDFALALGRGENSAPLVISHVDFDSLKVTIAEPSNAVKFNASVTIDDNHVASGENHTLVLVKKGVVFNERSNYTATSFVPVSKEKTATDIAKDLASQLGGMAVSYNDGVKEVAGTGAIPVKVTLTEATIKIEAVNFGEDWGLKVGDNLSGLKVTETSATPAVGDTEYIKKLAQECAQNKGYNYLAEDGKGIYPGYPEEVEAVSPDAAETNGYTVYTLRFANGRKAARTVDMKVSQIVHIAVPKQGTAKATLDTVFTIDGKTVKDTDE